MRRRFLGGFLFGSRHNNARERYLGEGETEAEDWPELCMLPIIGPLMRNSFSVPILFRRALEHFRARRRRATRLFVYILARAFLPMLLLSPLSNWERALRRLCWDLAFFFLSALVKRAIARRASRSLRCITTTTGG